jgi:lipopolysaccharide export system permease protein
LRLVKIVDRYVLKYLLASYAICLVSIIGLFVLVDTLSNMERMLSGDSFLRSFANYLAASVPMIYYQIAPGTFLMAAMFTLSGLNRSNELLALRASGVSIYRVLQPVVAASLLAAVVMAGVQEFVVPSQANTIRKMERDKPITSVVLSDAEGNILRVAKYYPYDKKMEDVVITAFYPSGDKRWRIHADSGRFARRVWLLLGVQIYKHDEHGILQVWVDRATGQRLPYVSMREWLFETDIVPSDVESADRDVNYLSFRQLNSQYQRQKYLPHLRVKLHSRIAFPLSCFVLLLLGVPFALRTGRKALLLNIAVCIAVASAFFVVNFFFVEMGADAKISPIAAAWLPIVIFTAVGLAFVESVRT